MTAIVAMQNNSNPRIFLTFSSISSETHDTIVYIIGSLKRDVCVI